MTTQRSEYAESGVDYTKIQGFKNQMQEFGKRTSQFPNRRGVFVEEKLRHAHGGVYWYEGPHQVRWCNTTEGLGNKNWIAEWMYEATGENGHYQWIGWDSALMAVNDVIAQGALPVIYTDEVAAGDSEWFTDEERSIALAIGFVAVCAKVGMALVAGESPALRYLVNAEPPVKSCPSLSGTVTGIIAPASREITGEKLAPGDKIIGVTSTGLHCNGISLVIKRAMKLPDQFLTKVPNANGRTLGEEALIPTRSYVGLVEALIEEEIDIHALVPATGDGVKKLAFDKRDLTYRLTDWPSVPALFQFMRELGVSLEDCLGTFNWGVGYYVIVPPEEVDRALAVGRRATYELLEVGQVEEGARQVIFGPESDLILPPPGE